MLSFKILFWALNIRENRSALFWATQVLSSSSLFLHILAKGIADVWLIVGYRNSAEIKRRKLWQKIILTPFRQEARNNRNRFLLSLLLGTTFHDLSHTVLCFTVLYCIWMLIVYITLCLCYTVLCLLYCMLYAVHCTV